MVINFYRVSFQLVLLLFCLESIAQSNQISIPRIDKMPASPSPYNMRNWKEVAILYDSFVYDANRVGQHLPLIQIQNNGYNYPQLPAFGLHTYLGTHQPNGNEGINVLPSLVGAALCGIDKTNQFGRDWIEMSQDFFSKKDNVGIYLNNKGGGSGSDWWYDLMPNVYFYQLYDVHKSNTSPESNLQFQSIADVMLQSVKSLGGSETPWLKGNFDYRGFNFLTKQPNPNGVHEPEAAGAYGWILYNAYRQTGDVNYRKGAEWAIEFLDEWQANPSYELMLPYGTLTAAKMNAEIGTKYNIEKMINWSFDRGHLRGWGTIVGKWGGFDVSGLVGEANDGGNDYAFQLNGIQQAAALVPLVRYDKRFAKAIGKWTLNLANATRLFYPGFLPGTYQDATAWSSVYDNDRVIGYEALREKWQGISPFSTGDAVLGNWAKTNLSLYSTGSIGYLGAIVEKTNVDKILKLDVLKTDFFKSTAFPTYLYYNPHNSAQTIVLDVGQSTSKLYDAIEEVFFMENVNGEVMFEIPANGVLLVTICPSEGLTTYDNNKMLVDNVVVDYNQTNQPFIHGPRIKSVAVAKSDVEKGKTIELFATIQKGESLNISYFWSASKGALSIDSLQGSWTAPELVGSDTITLIVKDEYGNSDTMSTMITVVEKINVAPEILNIVKSKSYALPGETIQLTCNAIDENDDPLTYDWTFTDGTIMPSQHHVLWTAPNVEGVVEVSCKVSDDSGLADVYNEKILIKNLDNTTSGNLVAYYKFNNNANDHTVNTLHGQPFSTTFANDIFNAPLSALIFNGVNSRVTVPLKPVLNFQDAITVTSWLKANDLPAKESFVISHGSWQNRWKISFTPEKYLRWTINTESGTTDLDTPFPLSIDSFYHVAVSYDGQLMMMYVNGQLVSFKFHTGKIKQANLPLLLGQMLPGNVEYNFNGILDEVKIFDYALSPLSIDELYLGALTNLKKVLPAHLPLTLLPNPVEDRLIINIPQTLKKNSELSIFNAAGSLMYHSSIKDLETFEMNVSSFETGTYWVFIRDLNGYSSNTFVKK